MSLTKEDKEFIKGTVESSYQLVQKDIDNVNKELQGMNTHIVTNTARIQEIQLSRADNNARIEEFKNNREATCPKTDDIKAINDDLMEYKMAKKYPKAFMIMMFLFGLSSILLTLSAIGLI